MKNKRKQIQRIVEAKVRKRMEMVRRQRTVCHHNVMRLRKVMIAEEGHVDRAREHLKTELAEVIVKSDAITIRESESKIVNGYVEIVGEVEVMVK